MEKDKRASINVCIVGHVDSGKSTTVGNLAFQLGVFDSRQLTKLKQEAESQGKSTFCYAYYFDTCAAERERGITINAAMKKFSLKRVDANIIDCPGHKDFIKNMVTGAAQADAAVAVVPASDFAAAISPGATLKDHIMFCGVMGVKRLIVLINKMDNFPKERQKEAFENIKKEMLFIISKLHPDKDPIVLPVSGYLGTSIADKSEKFEWFEGWYPVKKNKDFVYTTPDGKTVDESNRIFTFEGALNALTPPARPLDAPLRMQVTEIHTITGHGTVYTGRIDAGTIRAGMPIVFQPAGVSGEIKSLQIHRQDYKEVFCGENVGLALKSGAKGSLVQIKKGNVISDPKNDPCRVYAACLARIIVVDHPKEIKEGYCPVVDLGTHHFPGKLIKIVSKKGPKDASEIESPPSIMNKDSANVIIAPAKPTVMEPMSKNPCLARFAIRDGGKIVAVGSIKEVYDLEECAKRGIVLGEKKKKKDN